MRLPPPSAVLEDHAMPPAGAHWRQRRCMTNLTPMRSQCVSVAERKPSDQVLGDSLDRASCKWRYGVERQEEYWYKRRSSYALRRKRLVGADPGTDLGAGNPDLRSASSLLGFPHRAHP